MIDEEVLRRKVKAELRKRMRALRKTAPADACAQRSVKIVRALEAHPVVAAALRVALFWPIEERHEVDLRALDASLRARGARVAYPTIDPETHAMTFRFADADALVEAGFGFREPPASAPAAVRGEIDVIVVPALAIDPTGHRIGYGAGYYDRTIPAFAPPAATIAVAYDYQLIAEVPVTDGDVAVQWIVTDDRALRIGEPTND